MEDTAAKPSLPEAAPRARRPRDRRLDPAEVVIGLARRLATIVVIVLASSPSSGRCASSESAPRWSTSSSRSPSRSPAASSAAQGQLVLPLVPDLGDLPVHRAGRRGALPLRHRRAAPPLPALRARLQAPRRDVHALRDRARVPRRVARSCRPSRLLGSAIPRYTRRFPSRLPGGSLLLSQRNPDLYERRSSACERSMP